jgi:hypothetical protein
MTLHGYVKDDVICMPRETFEYLYRCMLNQKYTSPSEKAPSQVVRQHLIDQAAGWMARLANLDERSGEVLDLDQPTYLFHFCNPESKEMVHTSIGKSIEDAKRRLERALGIKDNNTYSVKAFVLNADPTKENCHCGK